MRAPTDTYRLNVIPVLDNKPILTAIMGLLHLVGTNGIIKSSGGTIGYL